MNGPVLQSVIAQVSRDPVAVCFGSAQVQQWGIHVVSHAMAPFEYDTVVANLMPETTVFAV